MINYLCFPTRGKARKDTNKTLIPNTLINYYCLKYWCVSETRRKKLKKIAEKFAD